MKKGKFEVRQDGFYLNDSPFRVFAGAIHYFRIMPECWDDRIKKLKACGLNTVETYIPWNYHEVYEGEYDFSSVIAFLDLIKENGLYAILRPSPYICSEWDNGGMPAWLFSYNCDVRCSDPLYLEKVENYYKKLIPVISKYQITRGGNVIMMQIENEYGSYGNDHEYMMALRDMMRKYGVDVPLFTSDGSGKFFLDGGTIDDCLAAVNFGSNPEGNFNYLREYGRKNGPLMCAEFWNGWFDHWFEKRHVRSAESFGSDIAKIIDMGASFSLYMFSGGTNFGFTSGANNGGKYEPTETSYDYDSLLGENGIPKEKYYTLKKILEDRFGPAPCEVPESPAPIAIGEVKMTESASLLDNLPAISEKHRSANVKPMEYFGQNYGLILYETEICGYGEKTDIHVSKVHDRAHVFVNGKREGIIWRNDEKDFVVADLPEDGNRLQILVENMGRINYGHGLKLDDRKGITDYVRVLSNQLQFGWDVYCMELDDISGIRYNPGIIRNGPVFIRGSFDVSGCADTYLRLDGFHKGQVWINDFNIGSYWNDAGPQKTLYVPGPVLREGNNEIIVLELDYSEADSVLFTDIEDLG